MKLSSRGKVICNKADLWKLAAASNFDITKHLGYLTSRIPASKPVIGGPFSLPRTEQGFYERIMI